MTEMSAVVIFCLSCTLFLGLIGQKSFKQSRKASSMQRAIFLTWACLLIRSLYLAFSTSAPLANQMLGASFCLGGLALFLWARYQYHDEIPERAFTEDAPTKLITSGPYFRIRHPIYSGYLICLLGLVICMGDYLLAVGWAGAVACYWVAAQREESLILGSANGALYKVYMRRSGRLFPWKFWVPVKLVE